MDGYLGYIEIDSAQSATRSVLTAYPIAVAIAWRGYALSGYRHTAVSNSIHCVLQEIELCIER